MAFVAARRVLLGLVITLAVASAQPGAIIGENYCSCSPSSYIFSFNFSATCETSNLMPGQPGLNDTTCLLSGGGSNGTDTVPVSLASVLIADLDQNLETVLAAQEANLTSDDIFTYTSFTASANASAIIPSDIPRGLAVIMTGVNAAGDSVQMSFVLVFNTDCDVFPVISAGDTFGWFVVVSPTCLVVPSQHF